MSPHCCGPPACLPVGADAAGACGGWKGLSGRAGSTSQREAAAAEVTSRIPWCGNRAGAGGTGWWLWSWACRPRLPAPTTGICFSFCMSLTFPRVAKSQVGFTVWPGDKGRQRPLNDGQGTPVPEASLRNSWCLSSVITGLVKPIHALILVCLK